MFFADSLFNTFQLSDANYQSESFTVTVDGADFYDGPLHRYSFIGEKSASSAVSYTPDNWTANSDRNLYLYLTGGDHILSVNGETFKAVFDAEKANTDAVYTTGAFRITEYSGGSEPEPEVTSVSASGTPRTSYAAGESFDAGELTATATLSDGTTKAVKDYTLTLDGTPIARNYAFTLADNGKTLAISFASGEKSFSAEYPITVETTAARVTFALTPADAVLTLTDGGAAVTPDADGVYTLTVGAVYHYTAAASGYHDQSGDLTVDGSGEVPVTLRVKAGSAPGGGSAPGAPISTVWDGKSIDVSWYSSGRTSFTISTAAQLAGLAAIVNGIYNDGCVVCGDASGRVIVDHYATGVRQGQNNESTDTYHFGADDFKGKTVYLAADLDMSAGNYMPIGGQYLMNGDAATKISASFNGVLDGQGHSVTIRCDRYCEEKFGDGESIGLVGRLGSHDSDPAGTWPSLPAVRNVAVYGTVRGNRSVGGVVGKIGKSGQGGLIEGCANFAEITGTDAKGMGGICGAAWNGAAIRNCYNAGAVSDTAGA